MRAVCIISGGVWRDELMPVKCNRGPPVASFVGLFYFYLSLKFTILSCLCLSALWSPAGKGLAYWFSCP